MTGRLDRELRDLLAESAELHELLDHYLAFGSTEQRHHAAACRRLALRLRAVIDQDALRAAVSAGR